MRRHAADKLLGSSSSWPLAAAPGYEVQHQHGAAWADKALGNKGSEAVREEAEGMLKQRATYQVCPPPLSPSSSPAGAPYQCR